MTAHRHPCGRPQVIATRANRRHGWKAGDVKPCGCLLCGPESDRMRKWAYWCAERHVGYYLCRGVAGAAGCRRVRICAGPFPETMICRECFHLPPV